MSGTNSAISKVPNRNVYLMLCYAFDAKYLLDECPAGDDGRFENAEELVTYVLVREVSRLCKGGLKRGYRLQSGRMAKPRGHVNMRASVGLMTQKRFELDCSYQVFTDDIPVNQVIAYVLRRVSPVDHATRKAVRDVLPLFDGVEEKAPTADVLSKIMFDKGNWRYRFVVSLCCLLYDRYLGRERQGWSGREAVHLGYEVLCQDGEQVRKPHLP